MKHLASPVILLKVLCLMVLLFPSPGKAQDGGTWTAAGTLSAARKNHTATLLGDGTVLVTGGVGIGQPAVASSETYDPATDRWTTVGSMISARYLHTATLLADGRVLVTGGAGSGGALSALAEIYDPSTGRWTATGALHRARYAHTASLLPNGMVLVAGGCCDVDGKASLTSSELWDPASGQWTITGDLRAPHAWHTATPLSDGTVLVAGGTFRGTASTASAELYDPAAGSWTAVGNLATARSLHTATLLNGDRVLLAGGSAGGCCNGITAAELYDPASHTWRAVQPMSTTRREHSAAVIAGGAAAVISGGYTCCNEPMPTRTSAEVFDLASQTWSLTGSMSQARYGHTLATLGDGTVVAAGGAVYGQDPVASTERFHPAGAAPQTTQVTISSNVAAASFTATGTNCNAGTFATPATLTWTVGATCTLTIPVPDGYVFSGWSDGSQANPRSVTAPASAAMYSFMLTSTAGTWTAAGSLSAARRNHTATPLDDGTLLVTGGVGIGQPAIASAEIYDPGKGGWTTVASMISARNLHTATRLADGRVLVAGGSGGDGALAEIYDPSTGQWTATGTLNSARYAHTASLLPNGMVLVAGGCCDVDGQASLTSSELWDPATEEWTITGDLGEAHAWHTATLLSDGTVLVAGGTFRGTAATASAEIYDPDTESWTAVGTLATARALHTASLLNGDRVLLAGGSAGGCCSGIADAELYDPASQTWQVVQTMSTARREHSATVIQGGAAAVISGGYTCCNEPTPTRASAEVFDLASQTWSLTGSMSQARYGHTLTTLGDGTVVAPGGAVYGEDPVASAERFHPAGGAP